MNIVLFMLSCVLTNNLIFGTLSFCPFMDGATNVKKSAVIGLFTIVCMAFVSAIAGALNLLLVKMNVAYLYPLALALAICLVMQITYLIFRNKADTKAELPMVAVSCLMLGIVAGTQAGFGYTILNSVCAAVGYLIAIVLMAGVRERIRFSKIPACMRGVPISFVTAGLMAIAFMGITGLH